MDSQILNTGSRAPLLPRAAPNDVLMWSDPDVWEGRMPTADDIVCVPQGCLLVIDQDVHVGALDISGDLRFSARDTVLRTHGIVVRRYGSLKIGQPLAPFMNRLTITLEGAPTAELAPGLGSRFLAAVDGGVIAVYGPHRVGWRELGATIVPGANEIRLQERVDWKAGERIAIASGGPELSLIEERAVVKVSSDGLCVTVDAPLRHRHLGGKGSVAGFLPRAVGRAVLLSRALVIEGAEDSAQLNYGAHCLIAAHVPGLDSEDEPRGSSGLFQGVEFRRMGQFNRVGRYPLHWHHNGLTTKNALIDSAIHQSYQRGVVIAGTRNVELMGNVVYRPHGHGFIVDDAERGDIQSSNLIVRPRVVRYAHASMRALSEHRPRAVCFTEPGLPSYGVSSPSGLPKISPVASRFAPSAS